MFSSDNAWHSGNAGANRTLPGLAHGGSGQIHVGNLGQCEMDIDELTVLSSVARGTGLAGVNVSFRSREANSVESANVIAAWIGILLGFLSGALSGLFFHRTDWLGGYSSWPRRMVRLGHISFFGLGFVNLGYALSVRHFSLETPSPLPSVLFIGGAVTMPVCCYVCAFARGFTWLFVVPVGCLVVASGYFLFVDLLT